MRARHSDEPEVGEDRVYAGTIRPEWRQIASRILLYTGLAWLLSFPVFTWFTRWGQAEVTARGIVPWMATWVMFSVLAVAGYLFGYWLMTRLTPGTVAISERRTVQLALGDAFLTMCGGFFFTFLPATLMVDPMMAMTWVFVVGMFFSVACLLPVYGARWRDAVAGGEALSK